MRILEHHDMLNADLFQIRIPNRLRRSCPQVQAVATGKVVKSDLPAEFGPILPASPRGCWVSWLFDFS
jgi:hypothetical protein